jgi:hypothetical protein
MDERERYAKYIEPYRACLLTFEFIVMPVAAVLVGYASGYISYALVMAISYLIADCLVMMTRGRTMLGIKIGRLKPWKVLDSKAIITVLGGLFLLFMTATAALQMMRGQLLLGLTSLCLVAMCISSLIGRWMKRYERLLSVLTMSFALIMVLLFAAYVEHQVVKLLMLLLALAWSFFVALGVYNVFLRRPAQGPQS